MSHCFNGYMVNNNNRRFVLNIYKSPFKSVDWDEEATTIVLPDSHIADLKHLVDSIYGRSADIATKYHSRGKYAIS